MDAIWIEAVLHASAHMVLQIESSTDDLVGRGLMDTALVLNP